MANEFALQTQDRELLLLQAQDALSMHQVWVARGRAHINGQSMNLPADFVKNEDLCPIGAWLRERLDPKLREIPLYERSNLAHVNFHIALDALFAQPPGHTRAEHRDSFNQTDRDLTTILQEWVALGLPPQRG
ncbi:MAG: hypothetical protein M3Y18_04955 [Candidatus Eremiobacteraeota bacterium]|nr:hypothetical protein [Candidatus Eremiobacteraeota bacterium]